MYLLVECAIILHIHKREEQKWREDIDTEEKQDL